MMIDKEKLIVSYGVLLVISFIAYEASTYDLVATYNDNQVLLVSITDSTLSPTAHNDVLCLEVLKDEMAGFMGLSATICLAQCLAVKASKYRANMA